NTAEALTRFVMGIRLSMFLSIRSLTFFISGGSLGATAQIFLIRALISGIALRFGLTSLIMSVNFSKSSKKLTNTPFTRWENAYIFMRFGLSFTRKRRFYHGKRSFLKTPAKVEISENSVFVFACELGQTEF